MNPWKKLTRAYPFYGKLPTEPKWKGCVPLSLSTKGIVDVAVDRAGIYLKLRWLYRLGRGCPAIHVPWMEFTARDSYYWFFETKRLEFKKIPSIPMHFFRKSGNKFLRAGVTQKVVASESLLQGKWESPDKAAEADVIGQRVVWLTRSVLTRLATSTAGNWEALYRDPEDLRLWELFYPQSEMHGGGPPGLRHVGDYEARVKYGIT